MKPLHLLNVIFFTLILCVSCKKSEKQEKKVSQKITLQKLENSPTYSNATLQLKEFDNTSNTTQETIDFQFEVKEYVLGAQTESPNTKELANSKKGQHIHFILNNQPYSAHYTPNFKKNIPEGVNHLVAFLSRSYHESVKNKTSIVVKKLAVGSNPVDTIGINIEAPTLIYSRPKGTYSGKDTKRILLDFFVLNTTISKSKNKIRAFINNQEFLISEWAPYAISGLPMGKTTIILELIDPEGNLIPGPFNKVKRTITLKE